MGTYAKRLKRNVARNQLLDRELDFLPATVDRDEVRDIARRYGPLRRRSLVGKVFSGTSGFFLRYGAPLVGMFIGAELRTAKALAPLMGREPRFGESLRVYLGENLAQKISNTQNAFQITGALVAATPDIIASALYGAVLGIVCYYLLRWTLILGTAHRRRRILSRRLRELVD